MLLRIGAQREQTRERGHTVIADQHTHPPQQLLTVTDPAQLL